jgi:hypothetical protein
MMQRVDTGAHGKYASRRVTFEYSYPTTVLATELGRFWPMSCALSTVHILFNSLSE